MTDAHFKISLRTLLICLVAAGAVLGLAARLFTRNPQVFVLLLYYGCTLGAFLAAVGTVAWLGVRQRRRGLVAWAIALTVTPVVGVVGAIALDALGRATGGPRGMGAVSNAALIATELPAGIDQPWVWDELEARITSGALSAEEADAALDALTRHMTTTKPEGWDQPLHWQQDFVNLAAHSGLASDESLLALAEAYNGPHARLEPLERVREGAGSFALDVSYGNSWTSNSGALPRLIWAVKEATLDGAPLPLQRSYGQWHEWHGAPAEPLSLAAGEHEVRVTLAAAYVSPGQLVGLNADDITPDTLPSGIKNWETVLTRRLTVYSQDDSLVRLLTGRDELAGGPGVRVERLLAQPLDGGRSKLVVVFAKRGGGGPDVSFDVAIEVDGRSVAARGGLFHYTSGNVTHSGGGQFEVIVDELPPSVQTADVVLTPNPAHVERDPGVEAIWGKPVILPGVPIERLDLRTGGASPRGSP